MKRTIKIIALLAGVFLLLFGSAFLYLYFNKSKVIQLFTQEVNKSLDAQMDVHNINLSLKKFPLVSIVLEEVTCFEPVEQSKDTLFSFEQVHFQFGLIDLIVGRYDLKQIDFDQGKLHVRTLPNGNPNYLIWKESEPDSTSEFELNLQKVVFNQTEITFKTADNLSTAAILEVLQVSGHFDSEASTISVKATGQLQHVILDGESYLNNALPLQIDFDIQNSQEATRLQSGVLVLNETQLAISGYSNSKQQHWEAAAKNTTPGALLAFVPKKLFGEKGLPEADGKMTLNIQYDQSADEDAAITADFTLAKGAIMLPNLGEQLRQIEAEGRYFKDGKLEKIQLNTIEFSYGKLKASGLGSLSSFSKPKVNFQFQAEGSAQQVVELMGMGEEATAGGDVALDIKFDHTYLNWEQLQEQPLAAANIQGSMEWNAGSFTDLKTNTSFENIQTKLRMASQQLFVDQLSVSTKQSDIQFSGKVVGGLEAMVSATKPWHLEGTLSGGNVNIVELLGLNFGTAEGESSKTKNNTVAILVAISAFQYDDFEGEKLIGKFVSNHTGIAGQNVTFQALSGVVTTGFLIEELVDGYKFSSSSKLKDIDIQRLFSSFDNFGQEALTDENISGIGDCDLRFSMDFSKQWEPNTASLLLQSDLKITSGRLVNFTPLESLSSFVDIAELKDVRFATLSNSISIKNEEITIPEMTITSTALEVGLAGTHTFENQIEYSIRLKQRDLLGAKKRTKNIDDWFEETDRPGESFLWVKVKGDFDNLQVGLDKEKNRASLRSGWEQQKQQLNDKSQQTGEKRQEGELIFEWEE